LLATSPDELCMAIKEAIASARPAAIEAASAWQEEVWRSHAYETQALRWLEVLEDLAGGAAGD